MPKKWNEGGRKEEANFCAAFFPPPSVRSCGGAQQVSFLLLLFPLSAGFHLPRGFKPHFLLPSFLPRRGVFSAKSSDSFRSRLPLLLLPVSPGHPCQAARRPSAGPSPSLLLPRKVMLVFPKWHTKREKGSLPPGRKTGEERRGEEGDDDVVECGPTNRRRRRRRRQRRRKKIISYRIGPEMQSRMREGEAPLSPPRSATIFLFLSLAKVPDSPTPCQQRKI